MNAVRTIFFDVFPYICLASLVFGSIWRYRHDRFGWTSYSSQLLESKTLRWASPMWHIGLLGVLAGHFVGLVIPESWTEAVGISENVYHAFAVIAGCIFAVIMVIGFIGLLVRRLVNGRVRLSSLPSDKLLYPVLIIVLTLGLINTFYFQIFDVYNYRPTISEWFRSIFYLDPEGALVANAPWSFQLHAVFAFLLLGIWPYTRLVHVFSVPLGYATRPYVVYRSRKPEVDAVGRDPRPGWERPSLHRSKR